MAIKFRIPSGVKREATYGMELKRKFGYGGGDRTMQINSLLRSHTKVGLKTAIAIYKYYARNAPIDPKGINFDNRKRPSKGFIMWKLMGGDAGHQWSRKLRRGTKDHIEKSINMVKGVREVVNNGLV